MTVSVLENRNVDLDAIVAGGDAFLDRVKALKAAKDQHDAALANFNLGRDIVAAHNEAQIREQAAIDALSDAKKQAEKLVTDASVEADHIRALAQEEAKHTIAMAQAVAAKLNDEVNQAKSVYEAWDASSRTEIEAQLVEAKSFNAKADQQLMANRTAAAEIEKKKSELQEAIDSANKMRDEFQSKLEAIRMAAS